MIAQSQSGRVNTSLAEDDAMLAQRQDLAALLGLENPVSLMVLKTALHNDDYARNLLTSRRSPPVLAMLLRHPPPIKEALSSDDSFSNSDLLRRATLGLVRWAKTGFSVVDAPTLERRRSACAICPNLVRVPDRLAYKLTPGEALVCNKCGCKIHDKTLAPSESCPGRHPLRDGLTRWEEPWRDDDS